MIPTNSKSQVRSESIYGEIILYESEWRRLTLRTLNNDQFSVILRPQAWVKTLHNLGSDPQSINNLNTELVKGRWLFAKGIIYEKEEHIETEVYELTLTTDKSGTRYAHHPDWWVVQISQLADFYLNHLQASMDKSSFDFAHYHTYLERNGDSSNYGRQETAVLSRLIYGLATAYLLTGNDSYYKAAIEGCEYLCQNFCHTDSNETYWFHAIEFDADGKKFIVFSSESGDDHRAIACYEQIYALAGIAQCYRISAIPKFLDICKSTITFIRHYFRDSSKYGGYFSHIDPITLSPLDPALGKNQARKNWNSNGDHLPAYLIQLFLITEDPEIRQFISEIQDILLSKFKSSDESPFIEERFHFNWNPDHGWDWQQDRTVIGHNLKIIWNLLRLQSINRDSRTLDFCRPLASSTISFGFDHLRSGWFDMLERQKPHHLCWHTRKPWWQQEQGILALLLLQSQEPNEKIWSKYADASIDYYNMYLLDHEGGGVFFSVNADGTPWLFGDEAKKGSHSMGGYHAFELCYLSSVYSNILLRNEQLNLHFKVNPSLWGDCSYPVQPDLLPSGTIRIMRVIINGQYWENYDSDKLRITLPMSDEVVDIEVRLGPASPPFELEEIDTNLTKDIIKKDSEKLFAIRGYLCDHYLPIFRRHLDAAEIQNRSLCIDVSDLHGACPDGLRFLAVLQQEFHQERSLRLLNISDSMKQDLKPFLLHT